MSCDCTNEPNGDAIRIPTVADSVIVALYTSSGWRGVVRTMPCVPQALIPLIYLPTAAVPL
jgi:hypothetical protein